MITTRVAIVDDEPLARMRLRRLLSSLPNLEIVAECNSGDKLAEELANRNVDILFLDVHMHAADGFAAYAQLQEPWPQVVFVTAHSTYAVRAFDIDAADYLVKPISLNRLRIAVDRARRYKFDKIDHPELPPPSLPKRLALPIGRKMQLVEIEQLDCAFAHANYLEIRLDSQTLLLRKTLAWLEAELDPERFIRIHRSCIVRIEAVTEAEPMMSGRYKLLLANGMNVYSGRKFRDAVCKALTLKQSKANTERLSRD